MDVLNMTSISSGPHCVRGKVVSCGPYAYGDQLALSSHSGWDAQMLTCHFVPHVKLLEFHYLLINQQLNG